MNNNVQTEVLKTLRSDALHKVNQGKKRTHAFSVDFTDINPEFHGKFMVHYPSQMERLRWGVVKSELLGGNLNVDVMTDNIAQITAVLDTVLDMKPDWFDVDNEEVDYDILETVYMEYLTWANSFRGTTKPVVTEGDSTDIRSQVSMVDTENVSHPTNG